MRWIDAFTLRLRALFRRARVEREMDAELRFHLDRETEFNIAQGLSATEGVAQVGPPQVSQDGTAALINVIPEGSPTSDVTKDLVDDVRDKTIPASGVEAHVGGSTANQLDLAELIGDRLPLIIGTERSPTIVTPTRAERGSIT